MSAHDPRLHPGVTALRRWFGGESETAEPNCGEVELIPDATSLVDRARAQLVADIGSFLAAHHLEVSNFTLAVANDYLTASDGKLVRLVDARVHAREPITVEWLESITEERAGANQTAAITKLMGHLEGTLDEFGHNTAEAQSATSDYGKVLATHVEELSPATFQGSLLTLTHLAQAMLTRTRELEQAMSRSNAQTRTLRRNLARARRSASEDHLTGLPNRRAFDAIFAKEVAAARASGEQLIVGFCDIDRFKQVNDTHGHEAGDRVLKTVAQNLARISGDRCHVARHGGEEFAILFRGISLHEAWERLDCLRAEQAGRRLVNRATDTPFGQVTFSAGIADVFAYAVPSLALRAADAALYRAKDQGRDRVLTADR